jgi:Tfp pilus assembly PilM family ATPase
LTLQAHWNDPPQEIGEELRRELQQRGVKSCRLLVGLPRSHVETVDLELPPATEHELPTMVRHEVFRQLTDLSDAAIIDYIDKPNDAGSSHKVQAVVLRPEMSAKIHAIGEAAGHPPARIVVRWFAIASLFERLTGEEHSASLLLNLMEMEADMSVLADGAVRFSRTVRLPDTPPGHPDLSRIADEIRRTLAVVPLDSNHEAGVEHIYMFGDLKENNDFIERLAEQLQLPVSLLDPRVGVQLRASQDPQSVNRYTALIGMVRDEATSTAPIDFTSPRQPPEPPKLGRKLAFYTAVVAVVLLIVGYRLTADLNDARNETQQLATDLERENQLLEKLISKTRVVDSVEQWRATEINWLRELRELSQRFPPADQAMVQGLTMAPSVGGESVISMSVRVNEPSTISRLETSLRDEFHRVSSQRIAHSSNRPTFPFQFDTTVRVRPRPTADQEAANDSVAATLTR